MKRLFIGLTATGLATILVPVSVHASALVFDAAGNTAILYAPCYGRSRDLKTAFLFTLKFDDAGNWKIIKTRQMSKKELDEEQ